MIDLVDRALLRQRCFSKRPPADAYRVLVLVAVLASSLTVVEGAQRLEPLPPQPPVVPWPTVAWREALPGPDVDRQQLEHEFDAAFAAVGRGGLPDTRAVVVVHHGELVAERYANGYGPTTRLPSHSMAKSVTQALVGILVRDGRLRLETPADVAAWDTPGDPRATITLNDLLHMSSGLDDADDFAYPPESRAMEMTFGAGAGDVATFAAAAPLLHLPGTFWAYSTPTTMIVSAIIGRAVGGGRDGMLAFMHRELFDPIGMCAAVPEFDAAGTFLGGSYVHASARDWARFGYLYLRDGMWDGRRVLPAGWVDYTRTPAPAAKHGTYGAHFWLNRPPRKGQSPVLPGAPPSAFCAIGFAGLGIVVVPSHDLVVVRLGEMEKWTWPELGGTLARIIEAFPPVAATR